MSVPDRARQRTRRHRLGRPHGDRARRRGLPGRPGRRRGPGGRDPGGLPGRAVPRRVRRAHPPRTREPAPSFLFGPGARARSGRRDARLPGDPRSAVVAARPGPRRGHGTPLRPAVGGGLRALGVYDGVRSPRVPVVHRWQPRPARRCRDGRRNLGRAVLRGDRPKRSGRGAGGDCGEPRLPGSARRRSPDSRCVRPARQLHGLRRYAGHGCPESPAGLGSARPRGGAPGGRPVLARYVRHHAHPAP